MADHSREDKGAPRSARQGVRGARGSGRRRWVRAIFSLLSLSLLCALIAGGMISYQLTRPVLAEGAELRVEIPRGASRGEIIRRLRGAGVDFSPRLFRAYLRFAAGGGLRAGVYPLAGPLTLPALVERLRRGAPPPTVRVTLLPGWSRWEVADALAAAGVTERAQLLELIEARGAEGRLYPDSYDFYPHTSAALVLQRLLQRFERAWTELRAGEADSAEGPPESEEEQQRLLSLAALIEREARLPQERSVISRVFMNRIERRMKLQSDPSCVYGADRYRERPSPELCRGARANRWSTYQHAGLPPTPIGSPRLESIRAALRPSEAPAHRKLLYFVARQDGSRAHHFSESYRAHQAAVERYLRRP